ncbi:MAG: hypothetical protein H7Y88_08480 [Phycisphaerales bacterium]|nr:hypothetical protein [Phycisphaerales bacterium]
MAAGSVNRPPLTGEPRGTGGRAPALALLMMTYCFVAVVGILVWTSRGPSLSSAYTPSARAMVLVVVVVICVAWPLLRLSQSRPRRPLEATAGDMAAMLLAIHSLVWPLTLLARWPVMSVLWIALYLTAWTAFIAGVLALSFALAPNHRSRFTGANRRSALWMLLCLTFVTAGPLSMWFAAAAGARPPSWLELASPLTALHALTGTAWNGPTGRIQTGLNRATSLTLFAGAALWIIAATVDRRRRSPPIGDSTDDRLH